MKKGFTLIELLIVVAIIAILAAIAVPNFLEAQTRAKVSRVKNDQRSLATGLEAYYIDNNSYPCAAAGTGNRQNPPGITQTILRDPTGAGNINKYIVGAPAAINNMYTFAAKAATGTAMITTPISYITSVFPDPFMDTKGAAFGYMNDNNGWIVMSPGPDTDQSLNGDLGGNAASSTFDVETVYTSTASQPSSLLVTGASATEAYTYDPTNGTVSPGDIYRTKQ